MNNQLLLEIAEEGQDTTKKNMLFYRKLQKHDIQRSSGGLHKQLDRDASQNTSLRKRSIWMGKEQLLRNNAKNSCLKLMHVKVSLDATTKIQHKKTYQIKIQSR